jgi:hypothetical protein
MIQSRDEMLNLISDLHKDARGFRPDNRIYEAMSDDDLGSAWDRLCVELEETMARESNEKKAAFDEWNLRIETMMQDHEIDRGTALRWDMDGMDTQGDVGFYCYKLGIDYEHEHQINADLKAAQDGPPMPSMAP